MMYYEQKKRARQWDRTVCLQVHHVAAHLGGEVGKAALLVHVYSTFIH